MIANVTRSGVSNRELVAGLPATRDALVENNIGLVCQLAKGVKRSLKISFEDLVQEGLAALVEAVDRFDPSLGFEFATYAGCASRRRMVRYATTNRSVISVPCFDQEKHPALARKRKAAWFVQPISKLSRMSRGNVDDPQREDLTLADRTAPVPVDERIDLDELIKRAVEHGSVQSRALEIVMARFNGFTLGEIGERLSLSKERVRQIEKETILKLRLHVDPDYVPPPVHHPRPVKAKEKKRAKCARAPRRWRVDSRQLKLFVG